MIVHVHATYCHLFSFLCKWKHTKWLGGFLKRYAVCEMRGQKWRYAVRKGSERCHPHTLQNIFNLIRHFNQQDGARVLCSSCNQCTSLYIIKFHLIICFVDITSCLITILNASLLHISESATYILNVYTACHNVHTLSTKMFSSNNKFIIDLI